MALAQDSKALLQSTTSSTPKADPSTFLTNRSPPSCTSKPINFADSLPEYTHHFAHLIHNLLTPTECNQLLALAQSTTDPASTWAAAEVNIGNGRQRMILEARNCGRIIWDSFPIADRLMRRILPHLPEEIITLKNNAGVTGNGPTKREETWRISRLNERLRFLKYTTGMFFKEHCDGSYVTPDGKEISFLTVHVYLNGKKFTSSPTSTTTVASNGDGNDKGTGEDATTPATAEDDQPLRGGATRFFSLHGQDRYMDISPEIGACLVFQHRGLVHSGEEVESGVKYTVRSDVMYEKVE